jgi:predicted lipoprotein with Yx(FWY)xxD motif
MKPIHQTVAVGAVVALVGLAGAATAQDQGRILRVQVSDRYGDYLADTQGRAVYLFTKDTQGGKGQQPMSNCYDACATAWPPVIVQESPVASGAMKGELLSTTTRKDGAKQVTYNGWPLYYYVQDRGREEASGQDKHGFGGEWYLVAPDGNKVQAEDGGSAS